MRSLFLIAAATFASVVWAGDAVVSKGWLIVVPDEEPSGVQRAIESAARELAHDIGEATGLKLNVARAKYVKPGARGIYVGAVFAERAGLMPKEHPLQGLENVVAEKDGNIYLFGKDRPGRNVKGYTSWRFLVLPSVKAIANFMERHMDVRFLSPGRTGRDVPKRERISVAEGTFERQMPTMIAGPSRYQDMLADYAWGVFGDGVTHTYGGHTWPSAVPMKKYFKDHPEYFPMVNGERLPLNGTNALCLSNPDVERLLAEELIRRIDEGSEVVQLGQNDGFCRCFCPACEAYGDTSDYGEKIWILHRRVAERVYRERPEGTVQIISYGATAQPPKTFTEFPPNVMIEMMNCSESSFRRWKRYGVPRGFTNYIYLWGEYQHPGCTAKSSVPQVARAARRYVANGIRSVFRCGYGELFGTEGPQYYVFNRLLQDPSSDERELVEEYVMRAYGPAAKPMREFHDLLDERLRGYTKMNEGYAAQDDGQRGQTAISPHAADVIVYLYPPDVLAKLEKSLAAAERTPGLTDKQRRRLGLVRQEFGYAKNLATVLQLYSAYLLRPSPESFRPLADAIREWNAMIASFYDGKGRMRSPDGWPELTPFNGVSRRTLMENGELQGRLSAPFAWDVDAMLAKGVLPGASARTAEVRRARTRPELGDFTQGAWADAPWLEMNGIQLESVTLPARFKLLYDDENLYIAAETSIGPNGVVKETGRDAGCDSGENFDLMIDPTGTGDRHFHLIWGSVPNAFYDGARGLIEDPLDPQYGKEDASWNGEWTYGNVRDGAVWRTMAVLPFRTFGAARPSDGDVWRFNLGHGANLVPGGDCLKMELSLWSPNMENRKFTSPEAMGTLTFR